MFGASHNSGKYIGQLKAFLIIICFAVSAIIHPAQAKGPQSVADVAQPLLDAVVNISTSQTVKGAQGIPLPNVPKGSPFEEFFDDFFNRPNGQDQQRRVRSLGSGFVIDPSGIIVTNNHVIDGAEEIVANFNDGTKLKVVKILGVDPKTDIAILKVAPKKPLKAVKFGDSSKIRVGDWVMAIGNPFGLGGSLTVGIVSAKKRDIKSGPYDEFIQTDAAINRGNSGGPLFNMEGEVIGINTAIISPTGGSIGIGFSVPSQTAVHVINQLKKYGETRRGWLGVRIQALTDEIAEGLGLSTPSGALVAGITPGSPADASGIQVGDVILKFNNQDITTMRALPRIVAKTDIDVEVDVLILRKGKKKTIKVKIGRLIEDESRKKVARNASGVSNVLKGIRITALSAALRKKYNVKDKVQGVIIIDVKKGSIAAERNIKVGDVIVEVTQKEVKSTADVAHRVAMAKEAGRKSVLLLLADNKGDWRFVAVPVAK
ncbi:MAG: Do family serine endopeptidase [Methyloligellaceae bacterium]